LKNKKKHKLAEKITNARNTNKTKKRSQESGKQADAACRKSEAEQAAGKMRGCDVQAR
jgi:hypothetical protein